MLALLQDVAGLQVSMKHTLGMHAGETSFNLQQDRKSTHSFGMGSTLPICMFPEGCFILDNMTKE